MIENFGTRYEPEILRLWHGGTRWRLPALRKLGASAPAPTPALMGRHALDIGLWLPSCRALPFDAMLAAAFAR